MEFLDEKIIELMNEAQENNNPASKQEETIQNQDEQEAIDIHQPVIKIDDEKVRIIDQFLFEEKLQMRMPESFQFMHPELAALKYPSERRPAIIYTDESTTINLALTITDHDLDEEGVEGFQESMVDVLQQTQSAAKWLEEGITLVSGVNVGFIEITTPSLDGDIYNLMFFTPVANKALMGTFNCMEEDMEDWRPVAKAMIETLQIHSQGPSGGEKL